MDGNEPNPKEIRSDETYWFDGQDQRAKDSATVRLLISMIDAVVGHFRDKVPPYKISGRTRVSATVSSAFTHAGSESSLCWPLPTPFQAMIAVYPGNGTRYVKHVDNPVRDGRCVTTVYYCNEDWKLTEVPVYPTIRNDA